MTNKQWFLITNFPINDTHDSIKESIIDEFYAYSSETILVENNGAVNINIDYLGNVPDVDNRLVP